MICRLFIEVQARRGSCVQKEELDAMLELASLGNQQFTGKTTGSSGKFI